jgi:hypothetical protein
MLFVIFSSLLSQAVAAEMVAVNNPLPKVIDAQPTLSIIIDNEKRTLTLSELESLPMYQSSLKTYWGMTGTFQGVSMRDLFAHLKIRKDTKHITFRALDNYKAALSFREFMKSPAMLATRLNGQPIPLENKGPFILLWPEKEAAALGGTATLSSWVWSISEIAAQ